MKTVILGNGLLGSSLHKLTGWDILSRSQDDFDITKPELYSKFLLEYFEGSIITAKYGTVVNCIANTDTYSKSRQDHWSTNYKAVAELVDFCNLYGIKLVHISSDYVYSNSVENASEEDIPVHGRNWYSYTKVLADAYIELKSESYLVCRGTHKPSPFPYSKAWINQVGNFDYVDTISTYIVALIRKEATGTYNVGTELKTVYSLASKTSSVIPVLCPEGVPTNTTMNLTKLNTSLNENKIVSSNTTL